MLKRILREKAFRAFSFNFRNCESAGEWLAFFSTSSAAQELNFDSCNLHAESSDDLLATVRSNRKLHTLNLFGSKIGDAKLALLLEELAENIDERGALNLNLCGTGISAASMSKLAVLLPHIKSLNISYNEVSDENITPFLEALRSNFSLEFLDIGENNMRHDGAQELLMLAAYANNARRRVLRIIEGDEASYPDLHVEGCDSVTLSPIEKESAAREVMSIFSNQDLLDSIKQSPEKIMRLFHLAITEKNELLLGQVFELCGDEMKPVIFDFVEKHLSDISGENEDKFLCNIDISGWIRDPVCLISGSKTQYYERSNLERAIGLRNPLHGASTLTADDIKKPSADFAESLNFCTNFMKSAPIIAKKIFDLGNKDLAARMLEKAKQFSASYYIENEDHLKQSFLKEIETVESFINATPKPSPAAASADLPDTSRQLTPS